MREVSLFITIVTLFGLLGCQQKTNDILSPVTFYYCVEQIDHENDASVFDGEIRDSSAYDGDILLLLNDYLKGPENATLYNPFPYRSTVVNAAQDGNVLTINLSFHFDNLPHEELALALACLTQTIFEYTNTPILLLIPNNAFIDGSTYKTFTADSFIYTDNNMNYAIPQ